MAWIDDLFAKYARPNPYEPGMYYMPEEGTIAVKKELAIRQSQQNLPIVYFDNSGQLYLPKTEDISGRGTWMGYSSGPEPLPAAFKGYGSLLDMTKKEYATAGDPLGMNNFLASRGELPAYQYQYTSTATIPSHPAPSNNVQNGLPVAMSDQSYIFQNGKLVGVKKAGKITYV